MITVIIIDDERWVCQLIKRIVKWEELKFHIIGEAYDGNEAFELIKIKKPDLVITDIRMPGLDGISLIKNVKELRFNTKFIIISGYSDFEYAKSALKYGALGYILKPIDEKEFTDLLTSVRNDIFYHKEKAVEEKIVKGKLEHSLSQLREQYFLNLLLSGDDKVNNIDINIFNRDYECSFKHGCFQVVIFNIDGSSHSGVDRENEEGKIINYIEQVVTLEIRDNCFEIVPVRLKNRLVYILNYNSSKHHIIKDAINVSFRKIRSNDNIIKNYDLTVGIGTLETDFNLVPQSYNFAHNSIKARISIGVNRVIDILQYKYGNIELRELFPIEKEMKFACLIEVFDNKPVEILVTELFHTISERRDVNPCMIFEVAYEIVEVFYRVMRRINIEIEKEYISKSRVYNDIDECRSVDQILNYFKQLFDEARDFYNSLKQNQNRKAVEMVKSYICDHYGEDIKLNDVASVVFLNAKYLGELFKKETGINFSDYLINYRLGVAKELLKDPRYRINEIAESVGYSDAKHFSKMFKKVVGVSPAEYKKMFT